jgi:hypothetical protein
MGLGNSETTLLKRVPKPPARTIAEIKLRLMLNLKSQKRVKVMKHWN